MTNSTKIKMTKSNKSKKQFSLFYLGGIILAIILGILIGFSIFPTDLLLGELKNNPTYLLLIEGLGHLSILVVLGYKIKNPSLKLYAGDRIQTAGYLHTLIGFAVVISLLGSGQGAKNLDDIKYLLTPMGSALLTSIIGWLFGGEIAAKENYSIETAIVDISESLKRQNQQLNIQANNLKHLEERQIKILQEHQKEILQFYKHENKILENNINKVVEKIGEYNESILQTFNKFNGVLEDESHYLRQTFSNLNSALEDESHSFRHTFNRLNSVIENQSLELSPTFNRLRDLIEDNSHCLRTSFTKLQTASEQAAEFMLKTAESTQNTSENMSKTAQAVYSIADYLQKTRVLIDQLEALLKYITEEKMRRSA